VSRGRYGSAMTDIPEPVRAALDAANRGDAEAFLDSFSADGVVDDWGREFAGREAIRGWSDAEFIGKQVTLDVTAVEQDGGRTVITAQVGGNGFTGPSHFGFDVDGARLSRMTIRA
jgi:ketosteroid isomerase-like protein